MYADPTRCPECRAPIPPHPVACSACGLRLTGTDAVDLFLTLQRADTLVAKLRAAPATSVQQPPSVEPGSAVEPVETPATAAPPVRRGVSGASVPKILLGLGALCLLVASMIFLAVAWAWLGVGGRTLILLTLTGLSAGAAAWSARHGLRVAAEAFSVVAFGLLALDVVGAHLSGWLGGLDEGGVTAVTGMLVGGLGYGLTWVSAKTGIPTGHAAVASPLAGPQLAAGVGLGVVPLGLVATADAPATILTVSCLALLALGVLAHRERIGWLRWACFGLAALWWLPLVSLGASRLVDHPEWRELWLDGQAGAALAAAAITLVGAVLLRSRPPLAAALAGLGATLVTLTVAVPPLSEGVNPATLTMLLFVAIWAVALLAAPRPWRALPAVPLLASAAVPAAVGLALVAEIATAVLEVAEPWTAPVSVRLPATDTLGDPLLLVAIAVVGGFAVVALARYRSEPLQFVQRYVAFLAAAVALSVVVALSAYAIPLAASVAGLLVVAAGLLAWALPRTDGLGSAGLLVALLVSLGGVLAALPSVGLTLAVAVVVLAGAAAVAVRGATPIHRLAGTVAIPPAAGLAVWAAAELAGLDDAWRGLPVLLVLGAACLFRPRLELEIPAAAVAGLGSAVAVAAAYDSSRADWLLSLTLHLTLAGALVCATALLHPSRRRVALAGGLLLTAAFWVRLWDVGVTTPEAYTLPIALVLLALGLRRLRQEPAASTLSALGPGLVLGTVPSLITMLGEDPVSWRALLLGLGCLALVLVGTRLRWNAPLVIGAVVGALVVLWEAAPYAAEIPLWVVIAAAGALLTLVGVTWEHRLQNMRDTSAYLARLR